MSDRPPMSVRTPYSPWRDEAFKLRQENERLKDENRWLAQRIRELTDPDPCRIPPEWGLSYQESQVLLIIAQRNSNIRKIAEALWPDDDLVPLKKLSARVRVIVFNIRKKVGSFIKITTTYRGYVMSEAGRHLVLQHAKLQGAQYG